MLNNIELELRAEVTLDHFEKLLTDLKNRTKLISQSKRLSVMFLGEINKYNFDVRVRTNSKNEAEVVFKKGDFHTHDRIENSQKIERDQFMGIVKLFSLFDFSSKVTERENFEFDLGDDVKLVLVKAGSIAYVEIEKMSSVENLEKNKLELLKIIESCKLKVLKDDKEFSELCDRLTKNSDWVFNGTKEHMDKIAEMLKTY